MEENATAVYLYVVNAVVSKLREELNEGVDESVLTHLQELWELKMMQAGVIQDPIETNSDFWKSGIPIPVHDLDKPYEETEEYKTPTDDMLFPQTHIQTPLPVEPGGDHAEYGMVSDSGAAADMKSGRPAPDSGAAADMNTGRPAPYMEPPSPWVDVKVAYEEAREEEGGEMSQPQPPMKTRVQTPLPVEPGGDHAEYGMVSDSGAAADMKSGRPAPDSGAAADMKTGRPAPYMEPPSPWVDVKVAYEEAREEEGGEMSQPQPPMKTRVQTPLPVEPGGDHAEYGMVSDSGAAADMKTGRPAPDSGAAADMKTGRPAPYMEPPSPWVDVKVAYEEAREEEGGEMSQPQPPMKTRIQTPLPVEPGGDLAEYGMVSDSGAATDMKTGRPAPDSGAAADMMTGRPAPYMEPPSPWVDVKVAYEEAREEEGGGMSQPQPPMKENLSVKWKRDMNPPHLLPNEYIPQQDGAGDVSFDSSQEMVTVPKNSANKVHSQTLHDRLKIQQRRNADAIIASIIKMKQASASIPQYDGYDDGDRTEDNTPSNHVGTPKPISTEALEDEPPLNEDDDDEDDGLDDLGQGDEDPTIKDLVLAKFDKVRRLTRMKSKWKCTLRDGIMRLNDKHTLFSKAYGEFNF